MTGRAGEPDVAALRRRVHAFIADPRLDDFEELALAIFRRQLRDNTDYRRLVEARGIRPGTVTTWRDIPAVSSLAFKRLRLSSGPSAIVFRTSGTSRGSEERGEHHLSAVDLYQAALRAQFRRHVLPDRERIRILGLTPSPEWAPDSSLGFMVADLIGVMGEPGSRFFLGAGGLDVEGIAASLRLAEERGQPVALLGTVLSFVHLFEDLRRGGLRFRLPAASRVMDTGGSKGLTREVSRDELLHGYRSVLGIAPERVVSEYGMTELCSQFYAPGPGGAAEAPAAEGPAAGALHDPAHPAGPPLYHGPHWVRTRVIDPETNQDIAGSGPDRPGFLRHLDLANFDSVICVETEDWGALPPDAEADAAEKPPRFLLLGRAPGAAARGCSIAVDDLIERGRHG